MESIDLSVLDLFFSSFEKLLTAADDPLTSIEQGISIPKFTLPDIENLLSITLTKFKHQQILLNIESPVYIVGDIHGNLQDLLRIFRECHLDSTYLFLGDYVDRGQFSLECILFLFTLTCKYPERFYLIRGNHESDLIASQYGFKDEISSMYPHQLFDEFITVFNWMPLAAIVNNAILCVHGGIDPQLQTVNQINCLIRPINLNHDDPVVWGLLWNDPSAIHPRFADSTLPRGMTFGKDAVREFLQTNQLQYLIRGHECVDGVKSIKEMHLSTVFSSSNYVGSGNRCGVILVEANGKMCPKIFDTQIQTKLRSQVSFSLIEKQKGTIAGSKSLMQRIKPMTVKAKSWSKQLIFPLCTVPKRGTNRLFNRFEKSASLTAFPSSFC